MCYITATELKQNLGHYLELSKTEDIYVTKNNKIITLLTNPEKKFTEGFLSLKGCMRDFDTGEDYDELIGKEILKKCGY